MSKSTDDSNEPQPKSAVNWLFKVATWLITVLCFYGFFPHTGHCRARGAVGGRLLAAFFRGCGLDGVVNGYDPLFTVFLFCDSHASWRAIRWFNAPICD